MFIVATFAILATCTWTRHTDVGDAQLYQVVARHMVEDGRWTELRYLASVYPRFYEHLPFGLWPMAAAIRIAGDWAPNPLFFLFSLATLVLTGLLARRLAGPWAGMLAMLVLATTMNFFKDAGYALLDWPLVLFATAAAAPVALGARSLRAWLAAAGFAALAVAVKGPFGLVPLLSFAAARALLERSPRVLASGAAAALAAMLPVAAFLAARADWWHGYLEAQLLASITGARADGLAPFWFPPRSLAGRFWPGMALLPLGIAVALGWPRRLASRLDPNGSRAPVARRLALASLLAVAALCVPARKLWYHTLVVYPWLAIFASVAVAGGLDRALATVARARAAVAGLGAVAAAAAVASFAGLPRVLMLPPCVIEAEFKSSLVDLQPGEEVLLVPGKDWDLFSALAFERRATPWASDSLCDGPARNARFAIADEDRWSADCGFVEIARARGRVLGRR